MSDRASALEAHIPALHRYAWALCRNASQADDLVQDCLERALSRWHLKREEGSLRAWLFAILHNRFVSGHRSIARRGLQGDWQEAENIGQAPTQDGALAIRDVGTALQALPDDQRAVLFLVGVEDLSYEEAARVLGVPVGTVMSRLSRGREKLRRLLDGEPASNVGLRRVK